MYNYTYVCMFEKEYELLELNTCHLLCKCSFQFSIKGLKRQKVFISNILAKSVLYKMFVAKRSKKNEREKVNFSIIALCTILYCKFVTQN